MGIKCLTVVLDDNGDDICVLARSDNGDLTGHGEDLKQFLRGFVIVHDLKIRDRRSVAVNMGHLACVLIRCIRSNLGLMELMAAGTRNIGEEYIYSIYPRHAAQLFPSLLNLRVEVAFPRYGAIEPAELSRMTVIYDGLLDEFDAQEVQSQWERGEDALNHFVDAQAAIANTAQSSQTTLQ